MKNFLSFSDTEFEYNHIYKWSPKPVPDGFVINIIMDDSRSIKINSEDVNWANTKIIGFEIIK